MFHDRIDLMTRVTLLMLLTLLVLLAAPGNALGDEEWTLRIDGAGLGSTGSVFGGAGIAIALEYRPQPRLGIEVGGVAAVLGDGIAATFLDVSAGVSAGRPEIAARTTTRLRLRGYRTLSAAVNLHLTPDRRVDVYLGPMVAYSVLDQTSLDVWSSATQVAGSWSAWTAGVGTRGFARDDASIGVGFQTGFNVPIGGGSWGIRGSLRFLDVSHELVGVSDGSRVRIDLDPIISTIGVSYRF